MDYYKKQKAQTFGMALLFLVGAILQFVGHNGEGYKYLFIQMISLVILLLVLFLYNKKHS